MQARITQLASEGGKRARAWPVLEQPLDHHLHVSRYNAHLNINRNVCLNVLTHTMHAALLFSRNGVQLPELVQCHIFTII